jgi:hypothetical protein
MNVETLQNEIVDLFTRLCGDPDNGDLACAADQALLSLDQALASPDRTLSEAHD